MPSISLKAHYDGKQIVLDEPFDLPPNAALMVTLLLPADGEASEWLHAAISGLARAYGEEEPEYSPADLKP